MSITYPIAITSSFLIALVIVFSWWALLRLPTVAEEAVADPNGFARFMIVVVILMVSLSAVSIYWCISMFAAAAHNKTMTDSRRR